MKTIFDIRFVLAVALALSTTQVSAEPVLFEANGHYYEVVADPGSNYDNAEDAWNAASHAASIKKVAGEFGHLATITSAEEDAFIEGLRAAAALNKPEVWLGGYQALPCASGYGPSCGWTWVTGEAFDYTNWQNGEPNDAGGEEHLLGAGHGNVPGWNDELRQNNAGGFVIEWDTVIEFNGDDCTVEAGGCGPAGVSYAVPGLENPEDETVTFTSVVSEDDDELCGMSERDFTISTPSGDVNTTMPKYLCGVKNPVTGKREFVAIVVETSFDLSEGAVLVETEPSEFFPNALDCNDPVPAGVDLREQDIVHFATINVGEMPRVHSDDATNGCGSSRGKIRGTILFLNTQYVFKDGVGNDLDWTANPESVEQAFIAVTRDKLVDLNQIIRNATPIRSDRYRYSAMRWLAGMALRAHIYGYYNTARANVDALNEIRATITFVTDPGDNPDAFIDIYASNIIFTYDVKVIPYAP